jgi:hypothetical protein
MVSAFLGAKGLERSAVPHHPELAVAVSAMVLHGFFPGQSECVLAQHVILVRVEATSRPSRTRLQNVTFNSAVASERISFRRNTASLVSETHWAGIKLLQVWPQSDHFWFSCPGDVSMSITEL